MRLRALSAFVLATVISCDSPTAPELFAPDQAQLDRATVISVDLSAHAVSVMTGPPAGVAMSLVGRDVIDATISNVSRVSHNKRKDLVKFDVALVNRITGVELRPPSLAPAPPNGSASVFFFPYHVRVTAGEGVVNESADWDGTPFSFFNDLVCRNGRSSDCFPWEAVPAPLTPGAESPSRTVGFLVDKGVTSFDVYLLTAADLVNIPTGSLEVTVSSTELGALPAVKVLSGSSMFAITDVTGVATFSGIATGSHSLTVQQLPAGCEAPLPASATVAAGQTTRVTVPVMCTIPRGDASGVVTIRDFGAKEGINVRLDPGGHIATTDADGRYSLSGIPAGLYAASVNSMPASCHTPSTLALVISQSAPVTMNVSLDCPGPVIAVSAQADVGLLTNARLDAGASSSPAGAPLTFAWTQTAGFTAHEDREGAVMTYPTGERPGLYSWRLDVSDGLRTVSRDIEQFVMETPGKAIFVSIFGNDNFPGTRAQPLKSPQLALDRAAEAGADVYMSAGKFPIAATLVLPRSVSVYGRMNPETWVHESPAVGDATDALRTVIEGPTRTVSGVDGGVSGITLAYLTIRGVNDTPGAGTAIGLSLINSSAVMLRDNEITAGRGMGAGASSFAVYTKGSILNIRRNHLIGGTGAKGADNTAGAPGHPGNAGSYRFGAAPAVANTNAGGDGGMGQTCETASVAYAGHPGDAPGGSPGQGGAKGPDGTAGQAAAFINGAFGYTLDGFVPFAQLPGGDGSPGGSGGGGGGGARYLEFLTCRSGAYGGGGGSGGAGGKGATSAGSGGASVALYVAGGQVSVQSNTLQSGTGGDGGDALALGGAGGPGGSGGPGAGYGGAGGTGGRGGPGHGGAGGEAVNLVRLNGGVVLFENNTYVFGKGGLGGRYWDGTRHANGATVPQR